MDDFPDTSSLHKDDKDDKDVKNNLLDTSNEKAPEMAERRVLAFLINHSEKLEEYFELIKVKDFSNYEYGKLFSSLKKIHANDEPFDDLVVAETFSQKANLSPHKAVEIFNNIKFSLTVHSVNKRVEGQSEEDFSEDIETSEHVKNIPDIFLSVYTRFKYHASNRDLNSIAASILKNSNDEGRTPKEQVQHLAELSSKFTELSESIIPIKSNVTHISSGINALMSNIRENLANGRTFIGIDTGFPLFNDLTSGYEQGGMTLLGGRPSMGKTAFALQEMINMALAGVPVLFLSVEMPKESIVMRMISNLAKVSVSDLKEGKLSDAQWKRVEIAIEDIKKLKFDIDDSPEMNITYVEKVTKEWMAKQVENKAHDRNHACVFIDYIQLLEPAGNYNNKNESTGEVSRKLKKLARTLNIAVVPLTQLNRSLEQRTNKRPINSDLRESGQLEQDADIIIFVYRDEVYNLDSQEKGIMELIISKQRNGPLATIKFEYDKSSQRLENKEVVMN